MAGGKVNIRGIPRDPPTLSRLHYAFSTTSSSITVDTLVISDPIKNKWALVLRFLTRMDEPESPGD
jgi:hypothetical protein